MMYDPLRLIRRRPWRAQVIPSGVLMTGCTVAFTWLELVLALGWILSYWQCCSFYYYHSLNETIGVDAQYGVVEIVHNVGYAHGFARRFWWGTWPTRQGGAWEDGLDVRAVRWRLLGFAGLDSRNSSAHAEMLVLPDWAVVVIAGLWPAWRFRISMRRRRRRKREQSNLCGSCGYDLRLHRPLPRVRHRACSV